MNIRKTSALVTLGLCSLVGVVAYRVGRARADGVPTASPLYYGGVLDDGGRPVEGMRNVTIRLWDMASGGTAACTTVTPNTPFSAGRFRIELDAACTGAVRANPNLWAEVLVDSTTFARTKLGAVPYALEAGRAAGASGALEARITAVEALAQPRQVVIGGSGGMVRFTGSPGSMNSTVQVPGTTLTFTPRATGNYSITTSCVVTGQADLSWQVVSTPAAMSFYSQPASTNTFIYNSSDGPSPYSPGSGAYVLSARSITTSVQALGILQSSTPYTFQVNAALTSLVQYTGTYFTTIADCGRVVITQLN